MPKTFRPDAQVGGWGEAERLALFLDVADLGGFSSVARKRGLAPSSVIRHINGLEADLGVALFRRSTRALALTEAGEAVREHAFDALRRLADTRSVAAALQAEPCGRLRLAAPASFGQRHIVPLIAPLLARYPKMQIELRLDDHFVDLVEEKIDLAVRVGELPDSTLVATVLARQRRVACAAPSYIEGNGAPAIPADLVDHICLTTPGPPLQGWWRFDGAEPLRVRGSFICRSTEALLRAALDGVGIVHLPTWLVGDALRSGKLVRLFSNRPMTDEAPRIHLIRTPQAPTPMVRATAEFIRSSIGSPPYWDA